MRGVVIVAGLASGSRVLFPTTKVYVMDMLYFHNIGRLASNKSPVQVVHGTHDEVIPFSNGQDLHAACAKVRTPSLAHRRVAQCPAQLARVRARLYRRRFDADARPHACSRSRSQQHPLPPAWIDGATHNNLETVHSVAYMRAFRTFIKHLLSTAPNTPAPKQSGWFDWVPGVSVAAKSSSPIPKVAPNAPAEAPSANKPTSEPILNPWASKAAAAP